MILMLLSLAILLSASLAWMAYRKRIQRAKALLPFEMIVVKQLLLDLQQMRFQFFSTRLGNTRPIKFTLRDVMDHHDGDHELSGEEYDDDPVVFRHEGQQLIDMGFYLRHEHLPVPVAHELKAFNNARFIPLNKLSLHGLIIISSALRRDLKAEELFEGDGTAFGSWRHFQECSHNLFYVVELWLKEHEANVSKGAVSLAN